MKKEIGVSYWFGMDDHNCPVCGKKPFSRMYNEASGNWQYKHIRKVRRRWGVGSESYYCESKAGKKVG